MALALRLSIALLLWLAGLPHFAAAQGSAHRLPPPLILKDGGVATATAAAPPSSPAGLKHHRRALLDIAGGYYQQLPYNNNYYYNPRGGGLLGYFVPFYGVGGQAVARAVAESNAVAVGPGATANAVSEANAVAKNVGGRRRLRDYDGYFPGRGHAYGRFFGAGGGQAVAQSLSNAQSVALGAGAQSNAVALSNAQAQNAPGGVWVLGGNGGGQAVAQSLSNAQSVALGPGAVSNAVALSNAQAQNLGKRRLAGAPPAAPNNGNGGNDGEYKSGSYTSDDGKAHAAWLVARSTDGASTFAASSASSVGP